VARAGDEGLPVVAARPDSPAARALADISAHVGRAAGIQRASGIPLAAG
jgi:hypothetical protein